MGATITIARVKAQRKRVKVFLKDDEEEAVSLPQEIVLKYGLASGLTMPRKEWWQLLRDAEDLECYEKLLTLLDQRFHAERELWRKLYKRKFPKPAIEKALAKGREFGLVDDVQFARLYVEEKVRGGKLSRRRIISDLRRRGVESQIVDQVMEEQAEAFTVEAAFEQALRQAEQKHRRWEREEDPRKRKEKMLRFLMGRGYNSRVCYQVVDVLINGKEPEHGGDEPPFSY